MAYQIIAFDGIATPEHLQRSDEVNIGTGAALISFQQISNGFFDNYGDRKSPQGIRPITKSCVLWGNTAAELKNNLDALRGKLGQRGKLTAAFDDGSLRWQWARLQNVNAPRPARAKANWLPCELTWITAAQIWYGVVVSPEEWTWGDLTWTFGDGTAEMGESGTSAALTASTGQTQIFTVSHGGNINATNVVWLITAGTSIITLFHLKNRTSKQACRLNLSPSLQPGESVLIDCGERSVVRLGAPYTITNVGNETYVTATANVTAHPYVSGDIVRISETDNFNNDWTVANTTSDSFTFANTTYATGETGTVREVEDIYDEFAGRWVELAPGDNTVEIVMSTGNTSSDATFSTEFYDHYA